MKAKKIFRLVWVAVILALVATAVKAEEISVPWNEVAQSQVMNSNELAKFGAAFPSWKIKQVVWPSTAEVESHQVVADPNLITSCVDWLAKFMVKNQLPANLNEKLVAMEEWGVVRKESEQERLCDVFITRFKKAPYVIHIQESSYNVVIAFCSDNPITTPVDNRKNLVVEVANLFLNNNLKPQVGSKNLQIFGVVKEGEPITRFSWIIESVLVTEGGKKYIDLPKAWKIGTTSVEAETDGRFVKFDIVKEAKGSAAYFDPYERRFSPSPDESQQQPKKPDYNTLHDSLPRGGFPPAGD
jgi:hypothetical protein